MIAIIDYNLGNIKSVFRAFERIGADVIVTSSEEKINSSQAIVVPGVGAFRKAMKNISDLNLTVPIIKHIREGKPYLGICLGLQILFSYSSEYGKTSGLDIIKGEVKKFTSQVKIPHMGWNTVRGNDGNPLFEGIEKESFFYFDHSYYVVPEIKVLKAYTFYGSNFVSAVKLNQVYGVQFHPEKSGEKGLKMLKNFVKSCSASV
ncbi:MAG: imidazole glycerol phosphate synthase subunit HisH [Elusimicrobiota bacterium]